MRYTDYLRWGALSALFLALFVPFIVAVGGFWPNLFFPYITGKNFAFRILIEFAFLCYVLLAMREPKYRPHVSTLMWTVLAFVGWMAVATALSVDPVKSFWSNFERMDGYITVLHMFALFVVAGAVLTADKLWDAFFNTSITLAAVQGGWALFQVLGWLSISTQSGVRADTTFGNATYLAVYLLLNLFLTIYMLFRTVGSRNAATYQMLYGVAFVLELAGVFFTETRGAILGVGGGLIVAALFYIFFAARGREHKNLRRVAVGAIAVVVFFAGTIYAVRDTSFVKKIPGLNRLASISLTETTVVSRLQYIWPMAVQGAMERPVTGWGQENFSFVFNKYYQPGMYNQEQWFDRAHNQFLDWFIAGGVPAFLLYIAFFVLAVWIVWRSSLTAGEQAAFLGLLAAYGFNNLFVFDNLVSAMYFFVILAFFHSLSQRHNPSLALSRPMSDHAIAIAAPVVLIAGALGMWALNAPGIARASLLIPAIQTQEAGLNSAGVTVGVPKDPKKNIAEFKVVLGETKWPGNPLGFQEVTEQLLQFTSPLASQQNLDPQTKLDAFTTASGAIESLIASRPGDARLELFYSTFLAQFGQTAQAIEHLKKALEYSPLKQQIQIQMGLTLLQAGDMQGAVQVLKQAYDAAPAFDSARIYYAATLYAAGSTTAADALLVERFGSVAVDNDQLLQVFMNFKLYDRAIAIWKIRLAASPDDVQTHLGIASAYFAACQVPAVLTELNAIAKLQPQSAAEMQALAKQIQDGTLKCGQ